MKTFKMISLAAAFCIITAKVNGQDFHLSQYDATSLYLNPALTGMYMGEKMDYKVYGNFRQQWRAIGKPYTTSYLAYDMPYMKKFGIGGYILNNRNGASNFNNLNFFLSGSYLITEDPLNKHFLSVGLQLGLFQKSFNPGKLVFDSQYSASAGGFDQGIPSGEMFDRTNLLKLDGNMGFFYKYNDKDEKYRPFIGLSVFHLTRPNESFTGEKNRMPLRYLTHLGCDIDVNDEIILTPMLLFMRSARAMELNIGLMGSYKLKDTEYDILYGLAYRNKDAAIIHLGLKQGVNVYRISYDINTSYLGGYTGRRGGIEFTAIYSGFLNRVKAAKI